MMIGGRCLCLVVASVLPMLVWAAGPRPPTLVSAGDVIQAWPETYNEAVIKMWLSRWKSCVESLEFDLNRHRPIALSVDSSKQGLRTVTCSKYDYKEFAKIVEEALQDFRKIVLSTRRMAMGGLREREEASVSEIMEITTALGEYGLPHDVHFHNLQKDSLCSKGQERRISPAQFFLGLRSANFAKYRLTLSTLDYFNTEYRSGTDSTSGGLYRQVLSTKVFSKFLTRTKDFPEQAKRWEKVWDVFDGCLGALEDLNLQISLLSTLAGFGWFTTPQEAPEVLLTRMVELHIGLLGAASIRLEEAFESLFGVLRELPSGSDPNLVAQQQTVATLYYKPVRFLLTQLLADERCSAGFVREIDMERLFWVLPGETRTKLQKVLAYQNSVRGYLYDYSRSIVDDLWDLGPEEKAAAWTEDMAYDFADAIERFGGEEAKGEREKLFKSISEIPADASDDWLLSQCYAVKRCLERCPWRWRSLAAALNVISQFNLTELPEDVEETAPHDAKTQLKSVCRLIVGICKLAMDKGKSFSEQARNEVLYQMYGLRLGHVFSLLDRCTKTWRKPSGYMRWKRPLSCPWLDQDFLNNLSYPKKVESDSTGNQNGRPEARTTVEAFMPPKPLPRRDLIKLTDKERYDYYWNLMGYYEWRLQQVHQ